GGLAGGAPLHLVDPILNGALVGGSRRAVVDKKLLRHTRVQAGFGRQAQCLDNREDAGFRRHADVPSASGSTTRNATTSKSLIPANSPFIAWVPPGENRLATARSSFLPTTDATARASSF